MRAGKGRANGSQTADSPVVRASRGVMIRSIVGSSARLVNSTVLCIAPLWTPRHTPISCTSPQSLTAAGRQAFFIHHYTTMPHLFKVSCKKTCCFHIYPHCPKHNRKVVVVMVKRIFASNQASLPTNLCANLSMRARSVSNSLSQRNHNNSLGSLPNHVEGHLQRTVGFSGLVQCCSSHQWQKCQSVSSLWGTLAQRG